MVDLGVLYQRRLDSSGNLAHAWERPTVLGQLADTDGQGRLVAEGSAQQAWMVDLRDPDRPGMAQRVGLPAAAAVMGERAWYAETENRDRQGLVTVLRARDLSRPELPVLKLETLLRIGSNSRETLRLEGRHLVLAAGDALVTAALQPAGHVDRRSERQLPAAAQDLALGPDRGLVSFSGGELLVLDRSAPDFPQPKGRIWSDHGLGDPLLIRDRLAVVAEGVWEAPGLRLLDLADPDAPRWRGELPGEVKALVVLDDTVVASGGPDLRTLDLADPDQPVLAATSHSPYPITDLAPLPGGRLAASTTGGGLLVFEPVALEPPATRTPETPPPSPTTPPATATAVPPTAAVATPTPTPTRPFGRLYLPWAEG
jgi:hypothetical protein